MRLGRFGVRFAAHNACYPMPQKPSREGLQITRFESNHAFIGCCCSSLAEHSLGNGWVHSKLVCLNIELAE
jgi:hypothetical protein